jgi:hypothetical protein
LTRGSAKARPTAVPWIKFLSNVDGTSRAIIVGYVINPKIRTGRRDKRFALPPAFLFL